MNEFPDNKKPEISKTFKKYCINILNEAKSTFETIEKELEKLEEVIDSILREIENCNYLLNNCIDYSKNPLEKKDIFTNFKNNLENYYNINDNIENINKNIKDKLNNITDFEFNPPVNVNSIYDSINDITYNSFYDRMIDMSNSRFSNFYNTEKNDNNTQKDNSSKLKCSICNNEESSYLCKHCNILLCNKCYNKITNIEIHNLINFDEIKSQNELNKINFFNSLEIIIKDLFLKSNYLLNNEKIQIENIGNDKNKNSKDYILKVFNYPSITNANDIKSYLKFIEKLNSLLPSDYKNNFYNIPFNITKMNYKLIEVIRNICFDEKINIIKQSLEIIDNNFFFEEEEEGMDYNGEILNDNSNTKIYQSIKTKKEKKSNEIESKFDKFNNKFYFVVNLVSKTDFYFNKNEIQNVIINKMNSYLSIDKNDILISFNNRSNFIDNFIRTEKFSELLPQEIKIDYPNIKELYDIKTIINNLFYNECDIEKESLDYNWNFINPNKELNLIRGNERYYPPYGWIGIGLKVIGIYNNDEWLNDKNESNKWATAYYTIDSQLSSNEIKKKLKKLIFFLEPKKIKNYLYKDGIYLYKEITNAENQTGTITLDKKRYKLILMVKALIDKILESKNSDYYILEKEYIRTYRILLKEII